jgi:hypothetical protein
LEPSPKDSLTALVSVPEVLETTTEYSPESAIWQLVSVSVELVALVRSVLLL